MHGEVLLVPTCHIYNQLAISSLAILNMICDPPKLGLGKQNIAGIIGFVICYSNKVTLHIVILLEHHVITLEVATKKDIFSGRKYFWMYAYHTSFSIANTCTLYDASI